jgi:hypothetical protein
VDTFASAFDSWRQGGSEVIVDLSDLFGDTRWFYFSDLLALIKHAELSLHEKDFLAKSIARYTSSMGIT